MAWGGGHRVVSVVLRETTKESRGGRLSEADVAVWEAGMEEMLGRFRQLFPE